ncbi:MAG: homoserine dehydrogenase [Planctomycetaceae bacterium]|jgi:homoserine dehydrogenase|nr:homoserine dehydrogenase [Planctomycetaceae bacterium]
MCYLGKFGIALLGFGTIGTGVADILINKREQICKATGKDVELLRIFDKDITTARGIDVPAGVLTDNLDEVYNDMDVRIVIELLGGVEPVRTILLKFLRCSKQVVTANKALLAEHASELFAVARNRYTAIAFEAAVCGGIPIVSALSSSLQANKILSINAIVNGTSNFILSKMEDGGTSYRDALAEAQRLGYAESNPSMDVDGTDAVQKLSILAQLGFRTNVDWKEVSRMGIEEVESIDFRFARDLGYKIKLLAVANRSEGGLELHVAPTLVRLDNPLSGVNDAFNAVRVEGDNVGSVFFQGLGAGRKPTASAVVGDVIDAVLGRTRKTFDALQLWIPGNDELKIKSVNDFCGRSYLRFEAADRPGVMRDFAAVFGKKNISIASMIQHEIDKPDSKKQNAVIILITHETKEGNLLEAIKELEKIPSIQGKIVRMRVQD